MRRGYKETTYGQRGGEGPNTGKSAVTYQCQGPDGKVWKKRCFKSWMQNPVMCFYTDSHGVWWVAGVTDQSDERMQHYKMIPATALEP